MSDETCILTIKDVTILEGMLERCLGRDDPMAPLLRRKIGSAEIVFGEDVPASVATLNSRVAFSVDGGEPDIRVISHERMELPVGGLIPLTSARGLALIGLREGGAFRLSRSGGGEETVRLERVLYQPEAARRERRADKAAAAIPVVERPVLRLVEGGRGRSADDFTDPGPSAA